MKVLILSQFYPPAIGGEERHVGALSEALASRGHRVSVATIGAPGDCGVREEGGVRVHRLPTSAQRLPLLYSDPRRPHALPVPDPELALGLSRIVCAERPDVVHSHNWIVNSALSLRLRTRAGMVLTLHDYSHVCAVKRLMHQGSVCSGPGLLKCLRCAGRHYGPLPGAVTALSTMPARRLKDRSLDAIIAVSTAVAEGNRLDAAKVPFQVIPNFIPDQLWAGASNPRPPEAGPAELPSEPFLLFVGDLNREKGLHVLLDAYARLPQRPPLVMMGRRCVDTPVALPEGATILTDCPHELVMHAFRRCLAAVAPSVWPDPCPTVVLEAMAAGCPLVTTPVGGIRDMVVDLETGLMVAPGDSGQLFGALRTLLDDRALATRLGQEARRRAKSFTASQVVPRIEDTYRSAVLARRAPATSSAAGVTATKGERAL